MTRARQTTVPRTNTHDLTNVLDSKRTLKKIAASVSFCCNANHFSTKWLTATARVKVSERET